jgi:pyruvate formate lyase activating enzyme
MAERAGLQHVYVYNDKGCDCAAENRPVGFYLGDSSADIDGIKKCAAACCGEQGVLLKKYERSST